MSSDSAVYFYMCASGSYWSCSGTGGFDSYSPYSSGIRINAINFKVYPIYTLIACSSNSISNSTCIQAGGVASGTGSDCGGPIITTMCTISGDNTLDFGNISAKASNNITTQSLISVTCTDSASVNLLLVNYGIVKLGPMTAQVLVDDKKNTTVSVNIVKNIAVTAELISVPLNIPLESYEGSAIIISTIQ